MGLRNWLFGCRGHHWDDGEVIGQGEVRFRKRMTRLGEAPYRVEAKHLYRCQHDGCGETKEGWETTRTFDEHVWEALWDTLTEGDDGTS